VFFWAPLMKWCLVIAGVKDLNRPADKLSVSQNLGAFFRYRTKHGYAERFSLVPGTALAATGFIWVRYSLVITPVNYSLAAVRPFSCLLEAVWVADLSAYVVGQLLRRGHGPRAVDAYLSVGHNSPSHIFVDERILPPHLCRYQNNLKATTPASATPAAQ
jgi:hypothetical protein